MKFDKIKYLILLVLSLLATVTYAEEQQLAALSEEDFLADIPVVLTATRLAQPINEAPAAMTIIDRQMIEASGVREIAELFKLVPGFQVNHENGHTPIVTYNGLSDQFSRRMQVLVDGRSVYEPVFGGVDWTQLPLTLDDIERIEVTRGPNAASYGANAFLAIINIITRHASETTGVFTRYTTGSNEIEDGVLRFGATSGDLDFRLTLGYTTDDGFPDRYDVHYIHNALFRADYAAGANDNVMVQAGFTNASRGLDSGSLFPDQTLDKKVIDRFQQIRWQHEISTTQELQVQYYHNDSEANEYWQQLNAPNVVGLLASLGITGLDVTHSINNSYRTERHDLEVQHTYAPNKFWRIAWGGSVRRDLYHSADLTDNVDNTFDLKRLFANSELHASERVLFNVGAMVESNDFTGRNVSPRAAMHFKAGDNHTFRAVASKATRTPALVEKEGEIYVFLRGPAANLLPPNYRDLPLLRSLNDVQEEKITSLELGYNAAYPNAGVNLDIKLFKNHVEDLISAPTRPSGIPNLEYIVPTNVDDATIRGMEAYLDFKSTSHSRAIFSYAYTMIESDDTYQDFTETVPLHNLSILLSQEFDENVTASLMFYRVGDVNGLEDGAPIQEHNRVDYRIAFPFRGTGVRGEVAFVAQNVLGKYRDWRDDNYFEPRQFVTLAAQF